MEWENLQEGGRMHRQGRVGAKWQRGWVCRGVKVLHGGRVQESGGGSRRVGRYVGSRCPGR